MSLFRIETDRIPVVGRLQPPTTLNSWELALAVGSGAILAGLSLEGRAGVISAASGLAFYTAAVVDHVASRYLQARREAARQRLHPLVREFNIGRFPLAKLNLPRLPDASVCYGYDGPLGLVFVVKGRCDNGDFVSHVISAKEGQLMEGCPNTKPITPRTRDEIESILEAQDFGEGLRIPALTPLNPSALIEELADGTECSLIAPPRQMGKKIPEPTIGDEEVKRIWRLQRLPPPGLIDDFRGTLTTEKLHAALIFGKNEEGIPFITVRVRNPNNNETRTYIVDAIPRGKQSATGLYIRCFDEAGKLNDCAWPVEEYTYEWLQRILQGETLGSPVPLYVHPYNSLPDAHDLVLNKGDHMVAFQKLTRDQHLRLEWLDGWAWKLDN